MRIVGDKVLFWTGKDYMSNFYTGKGSSFGYKGHVFANSEQAFMWEKADRFSDKAIAQRVLVETNPMQAKRLGRAVSNYCDVFWGRKRYRIMVEVLKAKFANEHLNKLLMETGDKVLVEASKYDSVWGIGIDINDKRAEDKRNWRGQNLLGKALMEVREYYKEEASTVK